MSQQQQLLAILTRVSRVLQFTLTTHLPTGVWWWLSAPSTPDPRRGVLYKKRCAGFMVALDSCTLSSPGRRYGVRLDRLGVHRQSC